MANITIDKCLSYILASALTASKDITMLNFYFQKVDQVQFSELHRSTAIIKICECLSHTLRWLLPFQRIKFSNVDLQKVGQGHGVQSSQYIIRWNMSESTKATFYIFYFR